MILSREQVQKLILLCDSTKLGEQLPDLMEEVQQASGKVAAFHANLKAEEDRHQKAVRHIREAIREIQSKCRHPLTTYHGDPAGGSDSCFVCDVCDKQLPKRGMVPEYNG